MNITSVNLKITTTFAASAACLWAYAPIVASADGVAPSPEMTAPAKPKPLEKIIYQSPDAEDPIVPDAAAMCRFNYRGYDRVVYKSSAYMKKGENPVTNAELKSYTFYVNPLVMVEQDELQKELAKALAEKRIDPTGDVYEMSFDILLLDEEFKQAAAAAVNEHIEGAKITAGNIAVIPYKFIEVSCADLNGGRISLDSYPDRTVNRAYGIADRPNMLKVIVRGPSALLKKIASPDGRLGANFLVSGFAIKQNVVSASLYNLVQLGYDRFLNGKADWSLLHTVSGEDGGGGFSLGPIQFGDSWQNGAEELKNPCWVSRNQLRTVLERSFSRIDMNKWTEFKSDSDARNAVMDLLEKEVLRRSNVVDTRIEQANGEWRIQNAAIEADLGPSLLAKLNANIKAKTDLKNKESGNAARVAGGERDADFMSDSDITWGAEGNLSVPKSIELINVHRSAFRDFASMSFTETIATKGAINDAFQGAVTHSKQPGTVERDVLVEVPKKLEVWYNHQDGNRYVVVNPDMSKEDVGNGLYRTWCTPFDPSRYKKISSAPAVAASDERIALDPRSFGLPGINPRWPEIMDDEKWFIYDYVEEKTERRQFNELVDKYE